MTVETFPDSFIGSSSAMVELRQTLLRASRSDFSVLLYGESGTGKELAAQYIHQNSGRHAHAFYPVNCGAIPETLFESELFGHLKGAFTGADSHRQGLFTLADRGTLFLDEIAEMPVSMQPKILRALQEKRVRPVGGGSEVAASPRIIAATHSDLPQQITSRHFRHDLYYRLSVIEIVIPPLRFRENDILELANFFLHKDISTDEKYTLTAEASKALMSYPWPGNVRELENAMYRARAFSDTHTIELENLPVRILEWRPPSEKHLPGLIEQDEAILPLAEVERRHILRVLHLCQQNKSKAAELLRIDRKTLHNRLKAFELRNQTAQNT